MNKSYKTIYNTHTQTWVAVSEVTTTQGKVKSSRSNETSGSVVRLTLSAVAASILWMMSGSAMAADATCTTTGTQTASGTLNEVACGDGATASGNNSIAVGAKNGATAGATATGLGGIAIGSAATDNYLALAGASSLGYGSTSMGVGSVAASGDNASLMAGATAIGVATYANGAQAVALGSRARAEVEQAIAIGNDTRSIGTGSVSIGGDDSSSYNAKFTTGYNPNASGQYRPTFSAGNGSTAIAPHAQALTQGATAVGVGATAGDGSRGALKGTAGGISVYDWNQGTAIEATAVGALASATKIQTTAVGYKAQALADNSLVVGGNATASGLRSVVLGVSSSTSAAATNSVAIGVDLPSF